MQRLNPFPAHLRTMHCPFRASFEITSKKQKNWRKNKKKLSYHLEYFPM